MSTTRSHRTRTSTAGGGVATVVLCLGLALGLAPALASALMAPAAMAAIIDGDAPPTWTALITGEGAYSDTANDVALAGGATFVAGQVAGDHAFDMSLARFDGGVLTWKKVWDGPSHMNDVARCVATGPGGAVYVAGNSQRTLSDEQLVLTRYAATSGKVAWRRYFNSSTKSWDRVYGMAVDRRGNVVVIAQGIDTKGHPNWIVRSWSANGSVRWTRRVGGPAVDAYINGVPVDVAVARDGSAYVTGFLQRSLDTIRDSMVTVRYSTTGRLLWQRRYAGPTGLVARSSALALRPGGGVYVCGLTALGAGDAEGLVVGYSAAGKRTVFAFHGADAVQEFNDVAVTSTGKIVAAGYSTEGGTIDPYYVTYSAGGAISSASRWPGIEYDEWFAVDADAFGGFYLLGTRHLTATQRVVVMERRSVITGGGMFDHQWGDAYDSTLTRPTAIAVRGTTVAAVGQVDVTTGTTGVDQFVLSWTW